MLNKTQKNSKKGGMPDDNRYCDLSYGLHHVCNSNLNVQADIRDLT